MWLRSCCCYLSPPYLLIPSTRPVELGASRWWRPRKAEASSSPPAHVSSRKCHLHPALPPSRPLIQPHTVPCPVTQVPLCYTCYEYSELPDRRSEHGAPLPASHSLRPNPSFHPTTSLTTRPYPLLASLPDSRRRESAGAMGGGSYLRTNALAKEGISPATARIIPGSGHGLANGRSGQYPRSAGDSSPE